MTTRGIREIRTFGSTTDRRRARTPYGAHLELAALALRKQRLVQERRAAEKRNREINERVREMDTRSALLLRFIEHPEAGRPSAAGAGDAPRTDLPVRERELRY